MYIVPVVISIKMKVVMTTSVSLATASSSDILSNLFRKHYG